MRRRLLASTIALGLVVTAMGFTGIYAVFTDRATTGTNSAESGTQPKAADLKIAFDVTDSSCAGISYSDDLASGVIDATDLQPDFNGAGFNYICLQNVGTASLNLTVTAIDVVETETGCTGDEAAAGDATCGTAGIGDGELGTVLDAQLYRFDCVTGDGPTDSVVQPIETIAGTPGSLGSLDPGKVACIRTAVIFPGPGTDLTVDAVQRAQSDKVQWRFAFDGAAS